MLIGNPTFLYKTQKTGRDFQKSSEINTRNTKANVQIRHTRNQGTS